MKRFLRKSEIKGRMVVGLVILAFIILRIPSLFEPHWYADEGIYAAVARGMEHGKSLYVGVWDNKPPMIYLTYMLAGGDHRLLIIRWMNLVAGVATLYFMWHVGRTLQLHRVAIAIALVVTTYLLGTPLLEGNIANAENFFLPLMMGGYWLGLQKDPKQHFLSGMLFGIAFMYKFHPAFDVAALCVYLAVVHRRLAWRPILAVGSGFGLIVAVFSGWLAWQGVFVAGIQAALLSNVSYIQNGAQINPNYLVAGLLPLTSLLGMYLFRTNKINQTSFFLIIVLIWDAGAVFISGRPYKHYLIQIIPAWSLVVGYLIFNGRLNWRKASAYGAMLFVATTIYVYPFFKKPEVVATPVFSYYQKFIMAKDPHTFYGHDADTRIAQLSSSLQHYKTDKVVILAGNSWFYDATGTVPFISYVVPYHMYLKPGGEEAFIADLTTGPNLIVHHRGTDLPESVWQFIAQRYEQDGGDAYFDYYVPIGESGQ